MYQIGTFPSFFLYLNCYSSQVEDLTWSVRLEKDSCSFAARPLSGLYAPYLVSIFSNFSFLSDTLPLWIFFSLLPYFSVFLLSFSTHTFMHTPHQHSLMSVSVTLLSFLLVCISLFYICCESLHICLPFFCLLCLPIGHTHSLISWCWPFRILRLSSQINFCVCFGIVFIPNYVVSYIRFFCVASFITFADWYTRFMTKWLWIFGVYFHVRFYLHILSQSLKGISYLFLSVM